MVAKLPTGFLGGDIGRLADRVTLNAVIDQANANDSADAARILAEQAIENADQLGDAITAAGMLTKIADVFDASTPTLLTTHLLCPPAINALIATQKFDIKFKFETALAAGVSISTITYDGVAKDVSNLALEGLTSVYLSQLLGAEVPKRLAFSNYANVIDTIVMTIVGTIQQNVIVQAVISSDNFETESVLNQDFCTVDTEAGS